MQNRFKSTGLFLQQLCTCIFNIYHQFKQRIFDDSVNTVATAIVVFNQTVSQKESHIPNTRG